jgi:DNA-directed RNA polymerase specialized sigma24 family protein
MTPVLGQHDPMPMIMDRLTNIRTMADALNARLCDAKLRIERAIDGLPSVQRRLMRARYIEGKSWEVLADEMTYSVMQLHRIHKKALESLKFIHAKGRNYKNKRTIPCGEKEDMLAKSCDCD